MVIIPENSRSCNAVCGRVGQMQVNTAVDVVVNRSHLACAVVYCTLRDWLFLLNVREISLSLLYTMLQQSRLFEHFFIPIFPGSLVLWRLEVKDPDSLTNDRVSLANFDNLVRSLKDNSVIAWFKKIICGLEWRFQKKNNYQSEESMKQLIF